jgi:nucleotide-binding universal stress UspA family protein
LPTTAGVKRMLIALDESVRAAQVLRAGLDLAGSIDAQVFAFHAVELPLPHADADALLAAAAGRLRELLERTGAVAEPPQLCASSPWKHVLEAARRLHATVLVIGSHGAGAGEDALGSNAKKIVYGADRPVLVVHEERTILHLIGVTPPARA